jgi:hypothetical protein
MKLSEFLKKRQKTYDENIEYYEDKVNHDKICEGLNIPFPKRYFVLDGAEELRTIILPDECVIKYNNLSGGKSVIFRKNGGFFNNYTVDQVIDFLKLNNKKSELVQESIKKIKQKIIVEELLVDCSESKFLTDVKLYAFNGKCKYLLLAQHFNENGEKRHYDMNFNRIKLKHFDIDDFVHKKPKHLDKIIDYANKMAESLFPDTFLRIDFYSTTKGPMFGEFTFNPSGSRGFTEEGDMLLGRLL